MSTLTKKILLPKDAVGHNITDKIPIIHTNQLISEARALISTKSPDFESINYLYITTDTDTLKGIISIKELFTESPDKKLGELIKNQEIIKVHPKTDQERAARLAVKHSLKGLPVVDENNKLLGAILNDQILHILDKEAKEDLLRVSGILNSGNTDDELSVKRSFIGRIPWILFGLLGGLFTAEIISGFKGVLAENIILASFIPLVAYIANAVGTQTQTIFIRDLAIDKNTPDLKYSLRQFGISILIALACWAFILLLAGSFWGSTHLGFVVGLAVSAAIMVATIFALLIPYTLEKLNIDPAIGSGPFTTIIQDLLSIIIYFSIASAFYG